MKVADVMSTHVEFVSKDTKVKDVATLIFGRGINGLPVCSGKKVIGFITEGDIISKLYPSISEYAEDPVHEGDFESMEEKVAQVFELKAEEIMSKDTTLVNPQTPLLKAQSMMITKNIGRIGVVDEKNNLVGVVTKGDVFSALVGDRVAFTENQDYNDWLSRTYYAAIDTKQRTSFEIPDLENLFKKNKAEKIVDIGCGTGDHAIELAKKGFSVVGIDRSMDMIKEANKRKLRLSKNQIANLNFHFGETEHILKKLNHSFDAAIFMGNTISHNSDNLESLIKNASKYLSGSGVAVFQITNMEKVLKAKKRFLNFEFANLKNGIEREYGFLEFYDEPNLKNKTILKTFAILRAEANRWKWLGVRNSTMAYITKDSIEKMLRKNGFKKITFYGGSFDGRNWDYLFKKPYEPLKSDWLNIVAQK